MAKNQPYLMEGHITPHFQVWEFCNAEAKEDVKLVFSPAFIEHVQMLEELRAVVNQPVNITSGYRTASFNAEKGGDKNSAHLVGTATDVKKFKDIPDKFVEVIWRIICFQHKKIGGINFYTDGYHFCSNEDRFGIKEFIVRDYRGTKNDW